MTGSLPKILIYGYGNPGRQDDTLGVDLAEEVNRWITEQGLSNIRTESNYQLNLEDAAEISGYDMVIFADASKEDIPDFSVEKVIPSAEVEFTMHAVSPSFILFVCKQVFNCTPETYLLHIKGFEWEFMGEPTSKAKENFLLAFEYVKGILLAQSAQVTTSVS